MNKVSRRKVQIQSVLEIQEQNQIAHPHLALERLSFKYYGLISVVIVDLTPVEVKFLFSYVRIEFRLSPTLVGYTM